MFFLFKREAFMEGMFTMASATFKSLLLEEKFPLDSIGRCHKAKNIPCFNVLIQEEDNAPKATVDLVIESLEFPNHFLHHTEPFGVQSKLSVRDEWAQLYCYKELLSSTLRSWHIRLGKPLKILCKRGIPSLVNFVCYSRVKYDAPEPWVRWVCSKYCHYSWVLQICFHSKLLLEYLVHQNHIQNKSC